MNGFDDRPPVLPPLALADMIADREEFNKRSKLLLSAMKTLNPREQYIIQKRRLSDNAATLEELGSEFGISRERVRQVEVKAFEKLQKISRPSS